MNLARFGAAHAVDSTIEVTSPNPRRLDRAAIRDLIATAHRGDLPKVMARRDGYT